jgi:hypothetical protein
VKKMAKIHIHGKICSCEYCLEDGVDRSRGYVVYDDAGEAFNDFPIPEEIDHSVTLIDQTGREYTLIRTK